MKGLIGKLLWPGRKKAETSEFRLDICPTMVFKVPNGMKGIQEAFSPFTATVLAEKVELARLPELRKEVVKTWGERIGRYVDIVAQMRYTTQDLDMQEYFNAI